VEVLRPVVISFELAEVEVLVIVVVVDDDDEAELMVVNRVVVVVGDVMVLETKVLKVVGVLVVDVDGHCEWIRIN
jgi:hypothetical protein